jgi:uncharacterized protein (DUF1015 family)
MARVRPFAGFRYARTNRDITPVIAPPYDVISEGQRAQLLANDPHNVVALELPDGVLDPGVPGNRYELGARTWRAWRDDGTLKADEAPAVYVLEQHFTVHGKPVRRRAFIVEVGLEPFSAGVVLPHERTLPKALGDRFELTKATRANLSQVLGLFEDVDAVSNAIFDAVTAAEPVAEATDADGVSSTLWATTDPDLAARLATLLADKSIFIADGHHRYTTALAYRDLMRKQAEAEGHAPSDPAYDFVMMALVNMEDPELVVMPTHRVAISQGEFDAEEFEVGLLRHFDLSPAPAEKPWNVLEEITAPAFLVKTRADAAPRLATLREDVDLDLAIPLDRSSAWKHLDVAVLQELVLDPLLGINPDRPETLDRLGFVKGAQDALAAAGERDVVFVLRPTRMDQLRAVALAGETMPQKSTYFYPKLLSGLVFRSAE